jgi:hypothetical protein
MKIPENAAAGSPAHDIEDLREYIAVTIDRSHRHGQSDVMIVAQRSIEAAKERTEAKSQELKT